MVLAHPAIYFEEEMELEDAEAELEPLVFLLGRLLDQLCARLAARSRAAGAIHVRFHLEPGFEKEFRLKDEARPGSTPSYLRKNLKPARAHGRFQDALKIADFAFAIGCALRAGLKINLTAEAAPPRISQGGLFASICPDPEKVELTMARLAKLVGDANLGSPELLDTHRPEGFRMRRFVPQRDGGDTCRVMRRSSAGKNPAGRVANRTPQDCPTALRVFRPALSASVEVRQGCPARVAFPGTRGRVVRASGPWRGSGDWWSEDAWQSDEWDIEIHFDDLPPARWPEQRANTGIKEGRRRGVYRLAYDLTRQEWWVRGAYD